MNINNTNNQVYMTVLTSEAYIKGVKALKKSLIKVKSKHNLVILIPNEEEKKFCEILEKAGVLDSYCYVCTHENIFVEWLLEQKCKSDHWSKTFFKLCATDCIQYNKIILLDSDMLIKNNIDHLFNRPNYSAVASGKCAHDNYVKLNSGLMVIEPNKELFKKLCSNVKPTVLNRLSNGKNVGDQDVFQDTYPNWENVKELHLSEIYNCFFENVRLLKCSEGVELNDISVIHFIGGTKPWSNGCFTIKNIKQCASFLTSGRIYELKILVEYLVLSI